MSSTIRPIWIFGFATLPPSSLPRQAASGNVNAGQHETAQHRQKTHGIPVDEGLRWNRRNVLASPISRFGMAKSLPGTVDADEPNSHPGEVICKIEPLNKMVTETAIYMTKEDGVMRVTKIEISGENVAHVF